MLGGQAARHGEGQAALCRCTRNGLAQASGGWRLLRAGEVGSLAPRTPASPPWGLPHPAPPPFPLPHLRYARRQHLVQQPVGPVPLLVQPGGQLRQLRRGALLVLQEAQRLCTAAQHREHQARQQEAHQHGADDERGGPAGEAVGATGRVKLGLQWRPRVGAYMLQ